jgi:GNAT superfamily N-acetyltransferase
MTIQPIDRAHAAAARALLGELQVSLLGIQSTALHAALVDDALAGRIDGRIAADADRVLGIVLAAPPSYWRWLPLRRWPIALAAVRARAAAKRGSGAGSAAAESLRGAADRPEPQRSWSRPGDAWRIVFVGTAPVARGQGIAARLYDSIMRDRSLVARVAADNHASLRLHRSLGWRMVPDGGVMLAIHERRAARAVSNCA